MKYTLIGRVLKIKIMDKKTFIKATNLDNDDIKLLVKSEIIKKELKISKREKALVLVRLTTKNGHEGEITARVAHMSNKHVTLYVNGITSIAINKSYNELIDVQQL